MLIHFSVSASPKQPLNIMFHFITTSQQRKPTLTKLAWHFQIKYNTWHVHTKQIADHHENHSYNNHNRTLYQIKITKSVKKTVETSKKRDSSFCQANIILIYLKLCQTYKSVELFSTCGNLIYSYSMYVSMTDSDVLAGEILACIECSCSC